MAELCLLARRHAISGVLQAASPMIFIPSERLVFIHNPKCAGTSIHKALVDRFPEARAFWGRRYDAGKDAIIDLAHLTIAQARAQIGSGEAFRSFGFVRDPYARFASSYLHLKRWSPEHRALSIDALACDILDEERIRFDWKFIHFAPQYRFFYEGATRSVDRIWKTEELPSAWSEMQKAFSVDAPLASENRGDLRDSAVLGDTVVARINELYARDFALFGYAMRPSRAKPVPPRGPFASFLDLWPERRNLDITDRTKT
jgi:hypothetical protein